MVTTKRTIKRRWDKTTNSLDRKCMNFINYSWRIIIDQNMIRDGQFIVEKMHELYIDSGKNIIDQSRWSVKKLFLYFTEITSKWHEQVQPSAFYMLH